jgi:hypothetical protein
MAVPDTASVRSARSLARSPSPPCRSAGGRGRASTRTAKRHGSSGERQLPSSPVPAGHPKVQSVVPDPTRCLAVDPLSCSTSPARVRQVTDDLMQAFDDAPLLGPSLLRSIEVACHAISALPDQGCCVHNFAHTSSDSGKLMPALSRCPSKHNSRLAPAHRSPPKTRC